MEPAFNFNILTPKPFVLSEQPKEHLEKIRDEVMDKVRTWENRMSKFFDGYFIAADNWRIKPKASKGKRPKQVFNSKSGETHRATETLATVWQRMLTASDPYFETYKRGLKENGMEITEEELFATEGVLLEQLKVSRFKKKLLRSLRSVSLMGTVIVEEPFVSLPHGYGDKYMEFTDFLFRPMIRTGFDTTVCDIHDSDYIFTIDFISKWLLKNLASQDADVWDRGLVETHIEEFGKGIPVSNNSVYSRIQQSRARAGYFDQDAQVYENVNYHGRLEVENPVIQAYAEANGIEEPDFVDWSAGILDGVDVCKFHVTQYGDWHTRFKSMTYKDFEDEPLGYGVGQTGRKLQREMDVTESMTNDLLLFLLMNMFKVGKYSGYEEKEMILEPLKILQMEDINQLAPLSPDPLALQRALEMIALRREDFRNIVGAQTNLQAQESKGISATQSALSQTESIRSASVHAEVMGEIIREHLETSHINNVNHLDSPIWVYLTGTKKPMLVNKDRLPTNVGFKVKIVTEKNFNKRNESLLKGIQVFSSVKQNFPPSLNPIPSMTKEWFRLNELDPRELEVPVSVIEQMYMQLQRSVNQNKFGNEIAGEIAGSEAGGEQNIQETPVGPVETSPLGSLYEPETSVV